MSIVLIMLIVVLSATTDEIQQQCEVQHVYSDYLCIQCLSICTRHLNKR